MRYFLFLFMCCSYIAVLAQPDLRQRFDSLTAAYEQAGYHGVVLVAKDDKVLYQKGYGYANFDTKLPHRPSTLFKTESVGKMFTATAVLQLVEKGQLRLNQTVKEVLPELPVSNAEKITVDQLLKHTSGLQSPWDNPAWRFKKEYTRQELVKIIAEVPLAFDTPGKEMYYSNSGYYILGWMIEKITGKPYDTYFQETFFAPLGMTATRHLNDSIMPALTGAQPYSIINSKRFVVLDETVGPKASPAGGWISTAMDLHRFVQALNSGRLLNHATLQVMRTANGTNPTDSAYRYYAYGLETYINQLIPGANLYGHNGGGAGFSIDAFVEPQSGYNVISCTNLYQNSRPIMANYFRMALGKSLQPVKKPVSVRLYDLIDSIGMENFAKKDKDYFDQLGIQPHPGVYVQLSEAMNQAGDKRLCSQWLAHARKHYPEEGFLWVVSGDHEFGLGNTMEAKVFFEKALELGEKKADARVVTAAKEKLKTLKL